MRIINAIIVAIAVFWTATVQLAAAQEEYAPQKVVYHINQAGNENSSNYKGALTNIRNHIAAVGKDNIDLRVVMHGDGLGLLQDAIDSQQIQSLIVGLKDDG